VTALTAPHGATQADDALAWERLRATAARLGITVRDGVAFATRPWPDRNTAAIVSFGERIVLDPGLDEGLRADVLAMALIVAAVMSDHPADHPCAITAPAGYVLVARTRAPGPGGPGELATLLARACGRTGGSAAFAYSAPRQPDLAWQPWLTRWRGWGVPTDGAGRSTGPFGMTGSGRGAAG